MIEKFSDLNMLEMEIENNRKIKNNLEINIKKLNEKESENDNKLNLKYIKLKNLDELEKIVGFSIQDLKKLKSILIEISSEHKNFIEEVKGLFFELKKLKLELHWKVKIIHCCQYQYDLNLYRTVQNIQKY